MSSFNVGFPRAIPDSGMKGSDKLNFVNNLVSKGQTASMSDSVSTLVNKVLNLAPVGKEYGVGDSIAYNNISTSRNFPSIGITPKAIGSGAFIFGQYLYGFNGSTLYEYNKYTGNITRTITIPASMNSFKMTVDTNGDIYVICLNGSSLPQIFKVAAGATTYAWSLQMSAGSSGGLFGVTVYNNYVYGIFANNGQGTGSYKVAKDGTGGTLTADTVRYLGGGKASNIINNTLFIYYSGSIYKYDITNVTASSTAAAIYTGISTTITSLLYTNDSTNEIYISTKPSSYYQVSKYSNSNNTPLWTVASTVNNANAQVSTDGFNIYMYFPNFIMSVTTSGILNYDNNLIASPSGFNNLTYDSTENLMYGEVFINNNTNNSIYGWLQITSKVTG